jgi:hypothetical protein
LRNGTGGNSYQSGISGDSNAMALRDAAALGHYSLKDPKAAKRRPINLSWSRESAPTVPAFAALLIQLPTGGGKAIIFAGRGKGQASLHPRPSEPRCTPPSAAHNGISGGFA